ncbi:MAG: hypothetical protein COU08_04035 [Candidatus Harrisonbacteria bacterium CG10_big_fil_rev_8_21_14_0_10_42_17]|uniref:D-alanyl-D-alanine carboxypeptidase-like core domain-containing protein n=1 Tax=Candidatus Harrisonbacteria bacterium CG10_big_fil_rev_8_21_14_0_10_42_17 TaxID=1974584 RepID=A0A2M6WH81_9BACT|nr:MAG: hypothetical protein COU08_04035 [Candidatus Harrisonbacteria bacterium CG10_big_fil_rev_8_21_14_0_10_42_17]
MLTQNHFLWRSVFYLALAILLIAAFFGFFAYQYQELHVSLQRSEERSIATSMLFRQRIDQLDQVLFRTQEDNKNLADALYAEQGKMNFFEQQIREITGVVGGLEKLSKTDPELLKKYSKVFFLNEHYVPSTLGLADIHFSVSPDKPQQFQRDALPFLVSLLQSAENAGIDLKLLSAYRPFYFQASLKSQYTVTYGAGTANQFSADQGYSEHQLGTAIDFTTSIAGEDLSQFENAPAYQWLLDNAYRFGFILSYPEDNTYYIFEPWHWRFVGVMLAQKLHDEGRHFYDLDQRDIDEYLASLFDPI